MKDINKSFPGVNALSDVNFELEEGEVHALLGENGAGKSTLMNILSGNYRADSGEILLFGKKTKMISPAFAIHNGIGLVPQELNVMPEMSVAENIYIGNPPTRGKTKAFFDTGVSLEKAKELMDSLGAPIDVSAPAKKYSVAILQLVQIARALAFGAKILILDEPTATLTLRETENLFQVIKKLTNQGTSIIFITHRLEEVFQIADKATVMRDGQVITRLNVADTTIDEIIYHMAGKNVAMGRKQRNFLGDDIHLKVKNLTKKGEFKDVSFEVRRGEILGFGGLVGAGRSEVMLAIFGYSQADSGEIYVNGKKVESRSVKDAIAAGIGYLPEERAAQSLIPELSVKENLTISVLDKITKFGLVDNHKQQEITEQYIKSLGIKTPSCEQAIKNLSGGNQQKVVFGRWIERNLDILILDEPTRGIDVRSKSEIYDLVRKLADSGKTILLVSSEMEELLNVSDRIVVMNEGIVKAIVDNVDGLTQEELLQTALN